MQAVYTHEQSGDSRTANQVSNTPLRIVELVGHYAWIEISESSKSVAGTRQNDIPIKPPKELVQSCESGVLNPDQVPILKMAFSEEGHLATSMLFETRVKS